MPKQLKTDQKTDQKSSLVSAGLKNNPLKNRHFVLALSLTVLTIIALIYVGLNRSQTDNPPDDTANEENVSLAEQLEQVQFDDNVSQEAKNLHYLSVASAYMTEGDYDQALDNYLKAEEAGIINTRLLSDVAKIYEAKSDSEKRKSYLERLVELLEQETADIEDNLILSGKYISIGTTYEGLGDFEAAKANYQKAMDALKRVKVNNTNEDSVAEAKTYLEGRLDEL